MVTKAEILEAWVFLRKYNSSISDDTLDFMKDAAYEKLEKQQKLIRLQELTNDLLR